MNNGKQKISTGAVSLFIAGIIIFICGLILFIINSQNTSMYFYSIFMCVSGILFVLISMIKNIKSKSSVSGSKNQKPPQKQTENKK